jgi:putative hydrolase of the HAD superfamily
MTTVWVDNGSEQGPEAARDHIDYTVHALTPWLTSILED